MLTVKAICREEHLHDVEAVVFGQWAASRQIKGDCSPGDYWTVTMVPSGRCIATIVGPLLKEEALAVACSLHATVPTIDNWRKMPPGTGDLVRDAAIAALQAHHLVVR